MEVISQSTHIVMCFCWPLVDFGALSRLIFGEDQFIYIGQYFLLNLSIVLCRDAPICYLDWISMPYLQS